VNALEQQRYFRREDAVDIATKLAEAGVYTTLTGGPRGWQVTLNGHTDLLAVAKVLDTFKVEAKATSGSRAINPDPQPVNVLYRPYGGEGWPDVLIYWGSKP